MEKAVGVTMTAFEGLREDTVLKWLNKVNVARRVANVQLEEINFGEKQRERNERGGGKVKRSGTERPGRAGKRQRGVTAAK